MNLIAHVDDGPREVLPGRVGRASPRVAQPARHDTQAARPGGGRFRAAPRQSGNGAGQCVGDAAAAARPRAGGVDRRAGRRRAARDRRSGRASATSFAGATKPRSPAPARRSPRRSARSPPGATGTGASPSSACAVRASRRSAGCSPKSCTCPSSSSTGWSSGWRDATSGEIHSLYGRCSVPALRAARARGHDRGARPRRDRDGRRHRDRAIDVRDAPGALLHGVAACHAGRPHEARHRARATCGRWRATRKRWRT